jgi:hypothetical protein
VKAGKETFTALNPGKTPSSNPSGGWSLSPLVFLGVSLTLVFLVYLPLFQNDFVNWDDSVYIRENPHLVHLNLSEIRWMATTFYTGNWIPLAWFSLALDYRLGGLNAEVFHMGNLLLHGFNCALVFLLSLRILRLSNKGKEEERFLSAFWVSLLFGIHPLHVESVAWASERKDLLCGFFYLTSLWFYLGYLGEETRKKGKLILCFGSFCLALLSKSMAVTLPLVLLLLDDWPSGRLRREPQRALAEKIPFGVASILVGGVTVLFQSRVGTLSNLTELPISFRVMNAFHSLVFYLEKLGYPVNLAAFYPIVLNKTFSFEYGACLFTVGFITSMTLIYRRKFPFLMTAWFYFCITLLPVLGILQVGSQSAADRYSYLPSLGPLLLLSVLMVNLGGRWKKALGCVLVCGSVLLGVQTYRQIGLWKDSMTLWENVLKVNPKNSPYAYNNLGAALEDAGRRADALKLYNYTLLKAPQSTYPHNGVGNVLRAEGSYEESIRELRVSVSLDPQYDIPHNSLALDFEREGQFPQALQEAHEALRINPSYAEAYNSLGKIWADLGDIRQSQKAFRRAIYLDPQNPKYPRDFRESCLKLKFPKAMRPQS